MSTPYARRSYAGGAPATSIPNPVSASDTSFTVLDGAQFPTGTFFCVIDVNTAAEEKVFVGNRSANSFSAVLRGEDGTVQIAHAAGATIRHIGAAQDFAEANVTASMLTTKGDIMVKGTAPGPGRLPVGADGTALVSDSTAGLGVSWAMPVPVGTVLSTISATAPTGYLMLDGTTVTNGQTIYPALWAVIPAAWKSGTNILLPNASGRALVGAGTGPGLTNRPLGTTFGVETVTLAVTEMPSHSHGALTGTDNAPHAHSGTTAGANARHRHNMAGYTPQNWTYITGPGGQAGGVAVATSPWTPADGIQTGTDSPDHGHDFTTTTDNATHAHTVGAQGGGGAHANVQPSLALNMIIKAA